MCAHTFLNTMPQHMQVGQQLRQVSARLWEQLQVQSNPEYGFPAALEHLVWTIVLL